MFDDWDWETYPGAMSTTGRYDVPDTTEFLPNPEELSDDRSPFYGTGCFQKGGDDPGTDEILVCDDPEPPADPSATLVIAGGSHSVHWQEAYKALAAEYNWELLVVNKSGCVFMVNDDPNSQCHGWNEQFIEWLEHQEVDLVVANGSRINRTGDEYIQDGASQRWQQIRDIGPELVLMRGTPRPLEDVPTCLAEGNTPEECGPTTQYIAETNPLTEVELPDGAHQIDMIEYVCPEGATTESDNCPAVVGNVAVWFDNSHLSNTYVATMTPLIEAELREKVGWLFD